MKAIIFDLGAVLIDYDPGETFACIGRLVGESPHDLRQWVQEIEEPFGRGQMNGRDFYTWLADRTQRHADYDTFARAVCCGQARNETGLAFLRALAARPDLKLGIISNTNAIHAAWLRRHMPEFDHCHTVILSHEVGLLKPEAAIYELALSHLGVPAAAALFVDDHAPNVTGARAAGLAAIQHTDWPTTQAAVETWL